MLLGSALIAIDIFISVLTESMIISAVAGMGVGLLIYMPVSYTHLDYTQTDANFGTAEEFETLVDTAHEHGIRVITVSYTHLDVYKRQAHTCNCGNNHTFCKYRDENVNCNKSRA